MARGVVPATLHVAAPSSQVDWGSGAVRAGDRDGTVAAPTGRPRRAGVSSFGFSGTNAHVILEQAPAEQASGEARPLPAMPWLVSARTEEALAAQAERLAQWAADHPELDPADVAWSLACTRSALEHRAVVVGQDAAELATGLAAVAAGQPAAGVVTGTAASGGASRTVFVFPGQGGQWAGMGRDLAASSPVFAARLAECGRALARVRGLGPGGGAGRGAGPGRGRMWCSRRCGR